MYIMILLKALFTIIQMFHGHYTATFISEDKYTYDYVRSVAYMHTYVHTYLRLVTWYCSV